MNRLLNFPGDPKTYDARETMSRVVARWFDDRMSEAEMMVYLRQFKEIAESGFPSVPFMKDLYEDIMLETSVWFEEYGVGRPD